MSANPDSFPDHFSNTSEKLSMHNMFIRTQNSKFLQLSLPSSPLSLTPKALNLHQLHGSDPVQSPQLARMMMIKNCITSSPKTYVPENRLPFSVPAPPSPLARGEDKSYNDIVREISDFFKKFPAHPNDQMDIRNDATTSQSTLKAGSSSTTTRGHQRPLDGISKKLERFKIRTVQTGEVVKVEDQERK